jgi:hypothetical protein
VLKLGSSLHSAPPQKSSQCLLALLSSLLVLPASPQLMSLTTSLKRAPVLEGELDFVQSLKLTLYRTARSTKVVPTQENFDKVYGQGKVEIFAIDDLIGGDFTAALKGQ